MNFFKPQCLFALSLCLFLLSGTETTEIDEKPHEEFYTSEKTNHADIILVGGGGDLAKKYLWKGLFDLYQLYSSKTKDGWTFSFFGAGTKNHSVGWPQINTTLHDVIKCHDTGSCMKDKNDFINLVTYMRLKSDLDYKNLCENHLKDSYTSQNVCHKDRPCQYQRIFYLSVPPFTYESIAKYISTHCRPTKESGSLKVVLEKPFGHDQQSAISMSDAISQTLHDEEVFRVDHYLGKQAVEQIIKFRHDNKELENMMNGHFVERIEIVMKETVGVKGRTSFYDKYGVVCDVMQNHLSEILYLLTMDLPKNGSIRTTDAIIEARLGLLRNILPVFSTDVVLGQYEDYAEEVHDETDTNETSPTPTYAAVRLRMDSERWKNVPMILVAGKQMNERIGYARIIFKETGFSAHSKQGCQRHKQLIFHIGHGVLKSPAILVSKLLPVEGDTISGTWQLTNQFENKQYLHMDTGCFNIYVPKLVKDAYSLLIEQMFLGKKENFVTTQSLLESWKIWGNIIEIQKDKKLVVYEGGNQVEDSLDFSFHDRGLFFNSIDYQSLTQATTKFLRHEAVTGSASEIVTSVAKAIQEAAVKADIDSRDFHIAFSGGRTPIMLFNYLRQLHLNDIPWHIVHIWQVDERCSLKDSVSNFKSLCTSLINHIPGLKYENIHPMLTLSYPNELSWEGSSDTYEYTLKTVLGDAPIFDFVLLGVGSDGHTASLFPYNTALQETERYVTLIEDTEASPPKRMTLTYKALTTAKNIAVMIVGKSKCDIVQSLQDNNCVGEEKYPICKVSNESQNLTWFISDDAMCN